LIQAGTTIMAGIGFTRAFRGKPGGWLIAGVAALLLLILRAAGIPAAYGLGPARRGAAVRNLVRAFSPTALFFTGLPVLSGVASIIIHSNSLAELLDFRYGLLLLAKLPVFLLAMAIGACNLLRVQPALGGDTGTTRLRRSVRVELAVGAVVLLIPALLVGTALPGADAPRTSTGSAVEAILAVR
jgi:copper transport protein